MAEWSVYMLRCADGSLYTGIARDVTRRLAEHESGKRGAKYLRGRRPIALVFEKSVGDRGLALRIEHCLKQLHKSEKENFESLSLRVEGYIKEFGHATQ